MYQAMYYDGELQSPFTYEDNSWKYESGVLTVDGCFARHNHHREEEYQDGYKHQSLADKYRDMYDTFLFFEQRYQFKEVIDGVLECQLA